MSEEFIERRHAGLESQELISIRARLHEVTNQLHAATVRVEVTATKLSAAFGRLSHMESQLDRIESTIHEIQRAKANLDGRLLVITGGLSTGVSLLMWILTQMWK